jgi:hypothetical protein
MAWRLFTDRGQQVWKWLANEKPMNIPYEKNNQNSADRVYRDYAEQQNYKPLNIDEKQYKELNIPKFKDELANTSVKAALEGINYYKALQMEDGHWQL